LEKIKLLENECFPSWIQEGWIRPQFRLKTLSACGDGVVNGKLVCLISTTSPKSMKLTDYLDYKLNHMDLGTPPEPGGEIIGTLVKNELH
jgi:hypothetical protein